MEVWTWHRLAHLHMMTRLEGQGKWSTLFRVSESQRAELWGSAKSQCGSTNMTTEAMVTQTFPGPREETGNSRLPAGQSLSLRSPTVHASLASWVTAERWTSHWSRDFQHSACQRLSTASPSVSCSVVRQDGHPEMLCWDDLRMLQIGPDSLGREKGAHLEPQGVLLGELKQCTGNFETQRRSTQEVLFVAENKTIPGQQLQQGAAETSRPEYVFVCLRMHSQSCPAGWSDCLSSTVEGKGQPARPAQYS